MSLLSRAAAALESGGTAGTGCRSRSRSSRSSACARGCGPRTSTTPRRCIPSAPPEGEMPPRYAHARSIDGTWNDVSNPRMGAVGARFGRNVPLERTFVSRRGAGDPRAQPAARQPRAADAQGVHPGDDAEPARGRVAPVRGARLVQPRPRRGSAVAGTARGGRPVGREHDAHPAHAARPDLGRSIPRRRPTSRATATGGTRRRSTARARRSRTRCAARAGSCASTRTASSRPSSSSTSTSRAWPGTSGSASASCTRCSCSSTTRSATRSARPRRASPRGRTTTSTTARGSSTRRDGEDPHGRVDAGDHRAPDHEARR